MVSPESHPLRPSLAGDVIGDQLRVKVIELLETDYQHGRAQAEVASDHSFGARQVGRNVPKAMEAASSYPNRHGGVTILCGQAFESFQSGLDLIEID